PRSRYANEKRNHRGRGTGARLRRLADEGRDDLPPWRGGDSYWRVDGAGHDRVAEAACSIADLFACLHLQSHLLAPVCQAPADARGFAPLRSPGRGLSAIHGRHLGPRQRRDSRVAAADFLIEHVIATKATVIYPDVCGLRRATRRLVPGLQESLRDAMASPV